MSPISSKLLFFKNEQRYDIIKQSSKTAKRSLIEAAAINFLSKTPSQALKVQKKQDMINQKSTASIAMKTIGPQTVS